LSSSPYTISSKKHVLKFHRERDIKLYKKKTNEIK
jgi:hypothetical protein